MVVVGSAIYQNVPSEHSFSFSGILSKSEQIMPSDETFAFAGGASAISFSDMKETKMKQSRFVISHINIKGSYSSKTLFLFVG